MTVKVIWTLDCTMLGVRCHLGYGCMDFKVMELCVQEFNYSNFFAPDARLSVANNLRKEEWK